MYKKERDKVARMGEHLRAAFLEDHTAERGIDDLITRLNSLEGKLTRPRSDLDENAGIPGD